MPSQESSSWPDWKYPEWRGSGELVTSEEWLERRRGEDGAEGLWRVHDGLYDLTPWVHSHPGGSWWLTVTKGTDITEAFETHHIGTLPSKILANFYVRPAKSKRNSAFTFKPDGFYYTFKRRVYEKLKDIKPGPSTQSKQLLDTFAATTIVFSILAAVYLSFFLGSLAGITLTFTTICAHNFFHMRDNWRMYVFNLSLFTVREWRVSHALSHHLFPNTHYDLEISMFEPFLKYFPDPEKSKIVGISSVIYSPFIYPFIYFGSAFIRLLKSRPHAEDFICLLLPTLMIVVGRVPLLDVVTMWLYILMVSSFVFVVIGLNAAHHHPEIFHYGDKPRKDRDWGLFTLDATRDRIDISGSPYFVLMMFGDHTLHHLFPTVDHLHLNTFYPILKETCKEFGIDFKFKTQWELIVGQFRQLMRTEPNLEERTY